MLNKVPEITILFWIIKIMATTVGETGAKAFFSVVNMLSGHRLGIGLYSAWRLFQYLAGDGRIGQHPAGRYRFQSGRVHLGFHLSMPPGGVVV